MVIYTVVVTVAADSLPPVPTDDFQIGDRVLVGGTVSSSFCSFANLARTKTSKSKIFGEARPTLASD